MYIFFLPSSINLVAKNDQYICAEREIERERESGKEKERREKNLVRSGSISGQLRGGV